MKPLLRGIFLTSDIPEATATFYRDVAGLELEQVGSAEGYVYWKLDHGGLQLAIHDARRFAEYAHPARPDSNLTHVYFRIEDQERFLEHLRCLGVTPYAIDDVVITLADPDGRKVMFGTA